MITLDCSSYNEAFDEQFWDSAADAIAEHGYVILDHFVSTEKSIKFRDHIEQLSLEKEMKKAGIGKNIEHQIDESIRGDEIQWIEKEDEEIAESFLIRMKDALSQLNRRLFLGLKDFETHFTKYPSGTLYKKHRDRFSARAHRVITFVCYLNHGWLPEDGGQLLVYNEGETLLVEPIEGRMIIFQSQLEHEVLLTYKERYSITGWMLDQKEGLTFL